jgi:hypothetical protein
MRFRRVPFPGRESFILLTEADYYRMGFILKATRDIYEANLKVNGYYNATQTMIFGELRKQMKERS